VAGSAADLAGLLSDFDVAGLQRLARFARAAEEVTEERIREL
jgi:hypothetical protein